jgi:hypothetical protein
VFWVGQGGVLTFILLPVFFFKLYLGSVYMRACLSVSNVLFDFFSGVDMPDQNPLFGLSLSIGRQCYGLNLQTAVLSVQQDTEIN